MLLNFLTLTSFLLPTIFPRVGGALAIPEEIITQGTNYPGFQDIKYYFLFGDSYTTWRWDINASPKPKQNKPLGIDWPGFGSPNGPNWAAYLAQHFNYSQAYSFNMAFGGATIDRGVVTPFASYIWTFREQVERFLARLGSHPNTVAWPYPWTSDNGLFFFWFGINDVWRSHDWVNVSQSNLHDRLLTSYFAGIEDLYKVGARNIVILNVPPMELSPELRGRTIAQQNSVRDAVFMWNSKLADKVAEYRLRWKPATFFYIDAHAIFHSINVNAPSHGFLNKVSACPYYSPFAYTDLGYNSVTGNNIWESKYDPRCSGPVRRYMWLDAWHPTSKCHEIIAGKVVQALAEYP